LKPGLQRFRLSPISIVPRRLNLGMFSAQLLKDLSSLIGRAIVDNHDLQQTRKLQQLAHDCGKRVLLVVNGNNDG
jgi:hypothetical protein